MNTSQEPVGAPAKPQAPVRITYCLYARKSTESEEQQVLVVNVKRGLRARCEMGLWPCTAPTGYLNSKNKDEKCHVLVDPHRASTIKKMFEKVAYEKWSGRKIYSWLKDDMKFRTKSGKPLTLSNVYITLRNPLVSG